MLLIPFVSQLYQQSLLKYVNTQIVLNHINMNKWLAMCYKLYYGAQHQYHTHILGGSGVGLEGGLMIVEGQTFGIATNM